jgi:DnaA family protein
MLPPPPQDFDTFFAGENAAALAGLRGLAMPGAPVYLWGPSGCGKTHLLKALSRQVQAAGRHSGWFDAATPLPWTADPSWSLLVIDRAESLDGPHQQAAFGLFIDAVTHGRQVAAAGTLPPVDLPVREDLRTRLGWGLVFALQPLGEAGTREVLRREADRCAFPVSDEVVDYVLAHHPRDLSFLMALLARLDAYTLAHGRALTVPLVRQMLAEEGQTA